jgi:hypothetical protein
MYLYNQNAPDAPANLRKYVSYAQTAPIYEFGGFKTQR